MCRSSGLLEPFRHAALLRVRKQQPDDEASVNRVNRPRSLEVAAVWLPGEGLHSQHGPIGDARLMATFVERTTPASENLAQGLAQFQSKSLEIVEGLWWRTEG